MKPVIVRAHITGNGFAVHPIPLNKPLAVKTVVRDAYGCVLMIDATGTIYSPGLRHRKVWSEDLNMTARVVALLAKLGVITKDQAERHEAAKYAKAMRRDAAEDLDDLTRLAGKHGIKLPSRPLAKLKKSAGAA